MPASFQSPIGKAFSDLCPGFDFFDVEFGGEVSEALRNSQSGANKFL